MFLPIKVFNGLESFASSVYIAFGTILSAIVFLHIFKIRYLDYYEFIEEKEIEPEFKNKKDKNDLPEDKLQIEKVEQIDSKKEKIIIRDPNHNPFGFLEIITKCLISGLKAAIMLFVILPSSIALIGEVAAIILFFTIVKSGLLFWGLEIGDISAIIFTMIILILSYNFVISKRIRLKQIGLVFIAGCIICGIALAMGVLGVSNFDKSTEVLSNDSETSDNFIMNDKLVVGIYKKPINYIVKDDSENIVEVIVKHPEKYNINLSVSANKIKLLEYGNEKEYLGIFREFVNMINNKQIVHYINQEEINVYATQENINKLKNNYNNTAHN